MQRAVLGEALDVVAALHLVEHREAAQLVPAMAWPCWSKSRPQVLPPPSQNSSNRFVFG